MRKPRQIVGFQIRRYSDSGQVTAYCLWSDGSRTEGSPENPHILALKARAEREGLEVLQETW